MKNKIIKKNIFLISIIILFSLILIVFFYYNKYFIKESFFSNNFLKNKKIVIYPHLKNVDIEKDGGLTVLYYLAALLNKNNINTKIFIDNEEQQIPNNFCSNFVKEIDPENTVVVYCEGNGGNPLNAKYVVRWLLSELGKNVNENMYLSWGKNDLCYFYLSVFVYLLFLKIFIFIDVTVVFLYIVLCPK
jgi:hypothetical protein